MIVSRQHVELRASRDEASCFVRALHANAIKVYRGGEVCGTLLVKEGDDTRRGLVARHSAIGLTLNRIDQRRPCVTLRRDAMRAFVIGGTRRRF